MITEEKITLGPQGEVVSGEIKRIKKCSAEEFCQLYLKDNAEFYKLSQAEHSILAVCMYLSTYYDKEKSTVIGNVVTCNSLFIDEVKGRTGLKESTIRNSLVTLSKKRMIIKDTKHRGVYFLNPEYFFKGSISDRTKVIKNIIEYQIA